MAAPSRLLSVRRIPIMPHKISRKCPGKFGKPCPKLRRCPIRPIHPSSVNTKAYTFMLGYILVAEYVYANFVAKTEETATKSKK